MKSRWILGANMGNTVGIFAPLSVIFTRNIPRLHRADPPASSDNVCNEEYK